MSGRAGDDDVRTGMRAVPLSYERVRRRYRPRIREGIGSLVGAVLLACIGSGVLAGLTAVLGFTSNWDAGTVVTAVIFAGIAFWALGAAAVYLIDAIVELGGREPPAWRWYRMLGRNRHR